MLIKCVGCGGSFPETPLYPHKECPPCRVWAFLKEHIPAGTSVLDVGAGLADYRPALLERTGHRPGSVKHMLVEAHLPYVSKIGVSPGVPVLVGRVPEVLHLIQGHSFDTVICIDVLEHMKVLDIISTLEEMQRIARKRVIWFSPDGKHPQERDPYEMGADHWQTHRTQFDAVETPEGLEVRLSDVEGETVCLLPGSDMQWETTHTLLPDLHALEGRGMTHGALFGVLDWEDPSLE